MLVIAKELTSLSSPLAYHTKKIERGTAELLYADNFIKDTARLTAKDITERFKQRMSLNDRIGRKIVHFSVNFGVQENISDKDMIKIVKRFMKGIGFDNQPWLAYRHHDAAHEHVHVLSTKVMATGEGIQTNLHFLLKVHELTGKLENEFYLIKRSRAQLADVQNAVLHPARRISYGKIGLVRSLSNVLNQVLKGYHYTSLQEFNAILKTYNARVEKVKKHSGLIYRALDENGKAIGKGIPASTFLVKPTLANLEVNFERNREIQVQRCKRMETAVTWTLRGHVADWGQFSELMRREGISVVSDRSKDGDEDIYFVNHREKCVHTGSVLGLQFTKPHIMQQLEKNQQRQKGISLDRSMELEL